VAGRVGMDALEEDLPSVVDAADGVVVDTTVRPDAGEGG